MELIHSSLLLNVEEECVKMHDLVREVAIGIGENNIQSLLDLENPIKGNLKYIFWMTDKFPDEIDGSKLEYLSIFLNDSEGFNVTDTFFKEMTSIKVLIVDDFRRRPALSLANSLQPLKSVQTLILASLELGDISVLGNLLTLMTLSFHNCSIIELPKEFFKLQKLRSLEVERCTIERNNPFEVFEMCSKLEELTFVGNVCDDEEKDAISHNESPLTLHRYYISSEDNLSNYSEKYDLSRCFRVDELSNLVSHATFKQLVERAEVLWLKGEDGQRMWKNLVPDFFPIDKQEGVMNELIVLHLSSHPNMKYLIDTKDHDPSMSAFYNLAELHLSTVGVEDLCRGPPPSGFLEQLEILTLTGCSELKSVLFNAGYNLGHLKSMELAFCPNLMSVFQPYTARSLIQLKELIIKDCSVLEYIIVGEDGDSNQKNYYESLLPSLEKLKLSGVPSLIGIVKEYHQLMSSSMHKQSPPLSRHNSRNLNQSLATRTFSWVQACCSLNKLRRTSEEANITIFEDEPLDHTNPLKFDATIGKGAPSLTAQSLLVQSLKNVREITLDGCHNVISLSTLSIATSIIALETLTIRKCDKLKCITTHEGDRQVDRNNYSIFPTLEKLEIDDCEELEFLFVSAISIGLQKLKSLTVGEVPKLKCAFGNYQKEQHSSNQNQNDELHFDLPAFETLSIYHAPKINNIFAENYSMVNWTATEKFDVSTERGAPSLTAQNLLLQSLRNITKIKLDGCQNLISLSTLSSTDALETLEIHRCHKLKCITTHVGDALVDKNNFSILPTLEKLIIEDCEELEILFVSSISVGLQKLKSLTIVRAPNLKYVVGNCQKGQHSSNQNQNDELHFDLPSLKTLYIDDAPKMSSIFAKNCSMVNWTATEKFDASIDRGAPSLTSRSLLLQSLKNVKKVTLFGCQNIISLSTLSIVASTIALETLTIFRCHKLKCITTHVGDAHVDQNNCSIFPTLEKLIIHDCEELEILFVSSISVGLERLKSLTILRVPKLKYVVGNCQKEQHSSNQNQNDELHFDLPALETLYISYAPKINYSFAKNYSMVNWTATEEVHESTIGAPLFHVTQNLLKNIREIKLVKCTNLISLTTLSIASIILLEDLTIGACGQLKCIVGDEGDSRTQINYNSIFPKLKRLEVSDCDALEYLFPAYAFRSLIYLKSLKICKAPMLKYVFGRSQHDDSLNPENQNIQTFIDFPALEDLFIWYVPRLLSIYAENYYMRGLYLRSIILKELPQFTMRPFNEFLVCWDTEQKKTKVIEMCGKTLESLQVSDFKIEIFFDLTYMETEKKGDELQPLTSSLRSLKLLSLSELLDICVGPKCIIRFGSLQVLTIKACKKLKVIFSASIVRSLPMLKEVDISECEELVRIVGEDYETNADDHVCHEPCFPNLERVSVSHCDKLKYLFSITISDILPKLLSLEIHSAYELEHALIKRDKMEEIVMKDVLPELRILKLSDLANLISVCHGINFQKEDYSTEVDNCPKFDTLTTQHQADLETRSSRVEEKAEERLTSHMGEEITQQSFTKDELAGKVARNERIMIDPQQSTMGTQNFTKDELVGKEVQKETIMMEPKSQQETTGHDLHFHKEEEEGREDDVQLPNKSQALAIDSSGSSNLIPNITHPINSLEDVDNEGINEESVVQNESKTNVTCHADQENPSNITQIEQETSHSRGRLVESRDCTKSDFIEDTELSVSPFYTPMEIMPSFLETNNEASIVPGVQEIIHMMELEGFESLMFAKALETRPQLQLSTKDRSARVLCMSYRVLLDILNILTTKTPFTITEADKRLLTEHLKDAYLLGFDKDWIESIKTKVFNSGIYEVDSFQKVL